MYRSDRKEPAKRSNRRGGRNTREPSTSEAMGRGS